MESVSVALTGAAERGLTAVSGPRSFVQGVFCRRAGSLDPLHSPCAKQFRAANDPNYAMRVLLSGIPAESHDGR